MKFVDLTCEGFTDGYTLTVNPNHVVRLQRVSDKSSKLWLVYQQEHDVALPVNEVRNLLEENA